MGSILPPRSTANLSRRLPSVPYSLATRSRNNLANPAVNPAQVPLPRDPISSDSESDYEMSSQSPVDPDVASVEQRDQTKPPMLTGGRVSAQVLRDFGEGCESYFFHKEIQADKQVTSIIMGIKDHRIKDWYRANKAMINALTFDDFMLQLHTRLLKDGWRNTLQSEILSTTQGKKPFDDWQNSLGAQNSLLVNSASHIPEQQIRNHLNANMNPDTKLECDENKVHDEAVFTTWIEKVNVIDAKRLRTAEKQTRLVEDAMKRSKAILTGPSARGNKQTFSSTKSPTSSSDGIFAKLLDAERALLNAHEGCTKCRRFYVNHRARDCPNDFPAPSSYKTLTESMAVAAKRSKGGKKTTVAAVVEEPQEAEEDDEFVAVVGMSSSVIGDGTDSGSDEYVIPQKHLFLDVFVDSASKTEVRCNALIDNACTTVLIKPEFADKLKLRRMPLKDKVTVSLAVDSGEVRSVAGTRLDAIH